MRALARSREPVDGADLPQPAGGPPEREEAVLHGRDGPVGARSGSTWMHCAIGTLVERTTRYTILLHFAGLRSAVAVKSAVHRRIRGSARPPAQVTDGDQCNEMAFHADITGTLALPI